MRTLLTFAGLFLASLALAQVSQVARGAVDKQAPSGGPYAMPKQVIAGGGARASGGSYVLIGTLGQSAAGVANGGNFALQQGFHSTTTVGPAPDPIFRNGFE